MRQLKSCKVGHFVKIEGQICQVNCFYKTFRGRMVTLIPVHKKGETVRLRIEEETAKVEYIGERAIDQNGTIWVRSNPINPFIKEDAH